MGEHKEHLTKGNKATALTALASCKKGETSDCLSSEQMALLVDGSLSEAEREQCLAHLADCQTCYDEWRLMSIEARGSSGKLIRGPWFAKRSLVLAAAGSFLAAAASVLLYINLTPPAPVSHKLASPQVMEETAKSPVVTEASAVKKSQTEKAMMQEEEPAPAPALVFRQEAKRKKQTASQQQEQASPRKRIMSFSKEGDIFEDFGMADEVPMEQGMDTSASGEDMVDIANVVPVVIRKMSQLGEGGSITLLTYKRDRSLTLVKLDQQRVLIKEKGFEVQEMEVEVTKLRKVLKSLVKKEFPRSNKVRIVTAE